MRVRRSVAAAAAVAVSGAQAQTTAIPYGTPSALVPTASASVSYMTVTYDDCPSQSMESMITVTNGITVTYCPECEMMSSATPAGPGYTTVYTTTYLSLCPTGVVPATYTVTESCTDATPTWTPGPSHIPNGFTVTTTQCTVCDTTPTAVTITEPCGCEATNGVPVSNTAVMTTPVAGSGKTPTTPVPVPAGASPSACNGEDCGGSGNQSPGASPSACNGEDCGGSGTQSPGTSPAAVPGSSPSAGSAAPAASASACNGEACGGSADQTTSPVPAAGTTGAAAPPYPIASTTTAAAAANCPGPQCRAVASSYPSGVSYGNTSGIEPSPGAASSLTTLSTLFVGAVGVAVLAFAL
ncbi:hypothetical protein LTR08_009063 [Meristemomyces frigidus]|nr:hypothetical protein LTR08_009063 [Meristemomyces frigidus]